MKIVAREQALLWGIAREPRSREVALAARPLVRETPKESLLAGCEDRVARTGKGDVTRDDSQRRVDAV